MFARIVSNYPKCGSLLFSYRTESAGPSEFPASFSTGVSIQMGRNFSPFTRLTLLVAELKGKQLTDLTDPTKCDLLYHTSKVHEGIENADHLASANEITTQGQTLFDSIKAGDMTKAEADRETLIESCKKLKMLV
jgi:hypothetical protein